MKLNKIFTIGTFALLSLTSCELKNDLMGSLVDKGDMGALELGVSVKQPVSQRSTKAEVSTNNFPITIQGTSSEVTDVVMEYGTLNEVPASIKVPVGQYTVSSHTPGDLEKKMTAPYYAGSTDITVSKDIASQVNVVCRMANSRIQMNYGEDFMEAFSSWTITIDDGTETALSYTESNLTPEPIYWHFGDNITSITVNIRAVTTQGNTVSERRVFKKSDASENYEEEGDAFTGGDALEINMGTVESSTGDLEGISITANITFEDEEEAVEIPTTDPDEPTDPEEPGDGGEETGESIRITEPEGNSYLTNGVDLQYGTKEYPEKDIEINMAIDNGIENLYVKVDTDDSTFEFAASIMGLTEGNGLDLTSDAATDLSDLFKLPAKGDTSYQFTLNTTLLDLLMNTPGYVGEHKFNLTVIDKHGQQATATLIIRVTETANN